MAKCPQCLLEVSEIIPIDIELRMRVKELDPDYPLSDEICRSCLNTLRKKTLGSGGVLLAQERAKEERKTKLWKSRVSLIKQGHAQMAKNLYSEAAISYEKYLRVLELCFDSRAGELTPQALKEGAKTAELTIVAGVYWDLIRIYDTSDKYGDRQKNAARQLALFIPFTPIFPDILKKAMSFQKTARHPEVIKSFIASAKKQRLRCFIATSAFEAPYSIEVLALREFRDNQLKKSFLGRKFIFFYYKISPTLACILDKHTWAKPFIRAVLRAVIKCVS